MKAFPVLFMVAVAVISSAYAQESVVSPEELRARTRSLALNTAIIQMGRDRLVESGGECSIAEIAQIVGNADLTEKFTDVREIFSPVVDSNTVRCYSIVSSLEEPPAHYVVAVNRRSCVYFLNGFDKSSWDDFVREEIEVVESDDFLLDLAKLYLITVEAERFSESSVVENEDDIEACDASEPDGKILPTITHGANGFTKLLLYSCDAATDAFWRHEFRIGVAGDVRLESKKVF